MAAATSRRKGFRDTSTAVIAREAGISQPYLFRLFRTKVLDRDREDLLAPLFGGPAEVRRPEPTLRRPAGNQNSTERRRAVQ
jgi:hypothetical protein